MGLAEQGFAVSNELDDWIREAVAPLLRQRGFRGGPRRFWRRTPGFVAGLQFQGSNGNVFGRFRFTINYGVWHEGIGRMTGAYRPDDWQVARRVSGRRQADLWWDVGVGSDRPAVAAVVLATLTEQVLPFLDATATVEGFRACVEAIPKPWGDDLLQQLDNLGSYDPAGDTRMPAQRRLEQMTSHPAVQEWTEAHPEAVEMLELASRRPRRCL
jgi:hypothetical protein